MKCGERIIYKHFQENRPVSRKSLYNFSDLVDIPVIEDLMNSFYKATGIFHGINYGKGLPAFRRWQTICREFHYACRDSREKCRQSYHYISHHLFNGKYVACKCGNGLMDYAIPIIIEGQHIATFFIGQLLHELPDETFFRQQALKYGFDEESYMKSLAEVPIISKEQTILYINCFSQIIELLAKKRVGAIAP